jgi:hypothetical protein
MDSEPQTASQSLTSSSKEVEKLEEGNVYAESKGIEAELAVPSLPPPPNNPPPNGGTKAWLQVLGSWMLIFNTWGTSLP